MRRLLCIQIFFELAELRRWLLAMGVRLVLVGKQNRDHRLAVVARSEECFQDHRFSLRPVDPWQRLVDLQIAKPVPIRGNHRDAFGADFKLRTAQGVAALLV